MLADLELRERRRGELTEKKEKERKRERERERERERKGTDPNFCKWLKETKIERAGKATSEKIGIFMNNSYFGLSLHIWRETLQLLTLAI
jgi:hypothetical protein